MTQRFVHVNGLRMQLREAGEGPLVLLMHGFPGLGYSFERQLRALAAAGYHAVAPDMRGYGGTDAPESPRDYALDRVLPDVLGLLDSFGADRAAVVGHDFGALVAWQLALRHPERVRGVVSLAVPYEPRRSSTRPTETFAAMARKHFLHVHYFQSVGVAERELDPRADEFLARIYHALSGHYRYLDIFRHPSEGRGYLDVLPEAPPLPFDFLSADDFAVYSAAYRRTGFRGGLSWYRAFDANWEHGEPWAFRKIEVPALFVAGERDPAVSLLGTGALSIMSDYVPDLRGSHLLPGAGHWVTLERTDEVNRLLLDFLAGLPS